VLGTYLRAATLGFAAGLRSLLPLALLALAAADRPPTDRIGELLRSRPARLGLALAAIGELVGDKLPSVPGRLEPAPLAGRVTLGALAGGLLAQQLKAGSAPLLAALVGALAAVFGAWLGYSVRRGASQWTGAPDALVAVAEDGLALALAARAAES
jgi:uncharacterized membrane protein